MAVLSSSAEGSVAFFMPPRRLEEDGPERLSDDVANGSEKDAAAESGAISTGAGSDANAAGASGDAVPAVSAAKAAAAAVAVVVTALAVRDLYMSSWLTGPLPLPTLGAAADAPSSPAASASRLARKGLSSTMAGF